MAAVRRAEATWSGDLMSGNGAVSAVTSGAFAQLPVTWASRTESADGRTSPEELLAAAHAACFSMALSNGLAQAGNAPDQLDTSATVTFQPGQGITKGVLTVRGTVPGLDADGFQAAAQDAKQNCPVSKALEGNVDIQLEARLG
jgi:lipoyl-dependent peroxiredoxin